MAVVYVHALVYFTVNNLETVTHSDWGVDNYNSFGSNYNNYIDFVSQKLS